MVQSQMCQPFYIVSPRLWLLRTSCGRAWRCKWERWIVGSPIHRLWWWSSSLGIGRGTLFLHLLSRNTSCWGFGWPKYGQGLAKSRSIWPMQCRRKFEFSDVSSNTLQCVRDWYSRFVAASLTYCKICNITSVWWTKYKGDKLRDGRLLDNH